MGQTITVRLTPDLARWLDEESRTTGISQGELVRAQLQKAKAGSRQPFMRLAGAVRGPRDLSTRKGFSRS
jgi:hypothetical protein